LADDPDPALVAEWRNAETLLLSGQPEEAYQGFTELLKKFPDHGPLLLGQARSAVLTNRLQKAESIYKKLLIKFPSDRVLLAESNQIKVLLENALSATSVNVKMRAGIIYDSNTNQGTASESMTLGYFPITVPDAKKIGSTAAYFSSNFNINHRLTEEGNWNLVADAGLYLRGNENSDLKNIKSSEWQWFRLGAGIRYVGGSNLVELRFKGEVFDYELTNHVWSWGPELLYLKALNAQFHLISQLSADRRDYQRNHNRDGTYGQFSQYGRWFFGENNHYLTVGGGFLFGRPKLDRFKYNGWIVPLRLTVNLSEKWEITPNLNYIVEKYKQSATVLEREDRKDKKIRAGLDLTYKVSDAWQIELNYSYNNSNSNSPLYDYVQHVVGLGLAWGF
jgi:hypothetical protein